MKVCINIKCLSGQITGIERYLFENLTRMLSLQKEFDVQIEGVCPQGMRPRQPELERLHIVEFGGGEVGFLAKTRAYVKRQRALYVNMSGGIALGGGVTVFHDARPALFAEYDSRASRLRFNIAIAHAKRFAAHVVAPSEFTKRTLVDALGFKANKITVIPNAWQHMRRIVPDETVFDDFPGIQKGAYYYTLGSLAPHKNLRWVCEAARLNPNNLFVVSGKHWDDRQNDLPDAPNLYYAGYLSDERSKALMMHCKAFVHPSLYEGFGLPPLEAASCGVPLVVSTAGSLPEVLGRNAAYVNPYDWHVNLDELIADTYGARVAEGKARPDYESLLAKYSWDESARLWMDCLLRKTRPPKRT